MAKHNRDGAREALGTPRSIRIGRRRYVVGIFWQVAESAKTVSREARALARERGIDADLAVKRTLTTTGEAQFGLARSIDNVPRNAVAAAAALADAVPQQAWVAVFPLTGGYWYLRVRNGMIMPDGDIFYEDEATARDRFEADVADGGFELLFSPTDWSSTSDELDFESILSSAKQPKLADINPAKANRTVLILFGVSALAVIAGWQGYQYKTQLAEQDRLARIEAQKQLRAGLEPEKKEVSPPWHEAPAPSIQIRGCAEAMAELNTNAPGFKLGQVTCSGAKATFVWNRIERANIRWIERWIDRQGDYQLQLGGTGETARVSIPADVGDARGKEPVYPRKLVRNGLISLGQATDTRVVVGSLRTWSPPGGQDPELFIKPDFAWLPYEITVSALGEWGSILDRIPGLVVRTIVWNNAPKTYQITGVIYVQN